MIDRLVHHAEILALKGDSYRLKDRDLARSRRPKTDPPHGQRAPELLRLGLRPQAPQHRPDHSTWRTIPS